LTDSVAEGLVARLRAALEDFGDLVAVFRPDDARDAWVRRLLRDRLAQVSDALEAFETHDHEGEL